MDSQAGQHQENCIMPIVHRKLLSIAFSGKRSHHNLGLMGPQLEALFNAFEQVFTDTHLQLLNGLADGADQIGSAIFMKGERPDAPMAGRRLLGAVTPFSLLEYSQTIQNKAHFNALYNQCSYRLHLDGHQEGEPSDKQDYKEAYRQQARILPRLGDIFLAAMSREEEGSKGGTKEAALAALTIGKPVILLNLSDLQFYFYTSLEDWNFSSSPPLTAFEIAEQCSLLYPMDIFLTSEAEPKNLFFLLRKGVWNLYENLFNQKTAFADQEDGIKELNNSLFYKIEDERKKANESSKYFMFQYRGGYLLNYCLAIAAIFIAVDSSTVHLFKLERVFVAEKATESSLLLLGILKVGVILLIIRNTEKINSHLYNAKAIKFRYMAERLRVVSYFSLLGILKIPKPFIGNHISTHMRDYQGEAGFRRIISDLIIHSRLSIDINKEYILETIRFIRNYWLEGQLAYYKRDLKKMQKMDKKLVNIPEWLSKMVLIIVITEIVELLLPDGVRNQQAISFWINWIIPVLIAATILLPGIITTINSMHFQTEARRLAFRNEIMIHQMERILASLERKMQMMEGNADGNNLLSILLILDEAASITTDEVAEWTMIYEKPVFEP